MTRVSTAEAKAHFAKLVSGAELAGEGIELDEDLSLPADVIAEFEAMGRSRRR